ncbi:hypothetical protein PR048_002580 [Dryococelus australis]|uniref:Uncharacterized protein n=1 Tax=Dryococelus australis TaxID=614101 RepID=A0ABQ9IM12_9NEOP|nr:hypothetical protein PR048_002580 [Dryococelus australis]
MFPDLVPEGFSVSPKKLFYLITDALGLYVSIRFCSDIQIEIVTHHLQTVFLGKATAEILLASLFSTLYSVTESEKHSNYWQ